MNSETNPLGKHPVFSRWKADLDARRAWAEANPQLASDWDAALDEDADWQRNQRFRHLQAQVDDEMPRLLQRAGVPGRCATVLLTSHKPTEALRAAQDFLGVRPEGPSFLLLLGAAGTGKSVAAAFAVRSVLRAAATSEGGFLRRLPARFLRAFDLARLSQYNREDQGEFWEFCTCHLLVLDDLGAEQTNSSGLALLDELVDHRYSERLATILTTNLDADTFKARYGERIADRIRHDGVIVGAGTTSLRRRT